ncbi:helix-turn-helix domain-containing protein [Rhodococcus erythropolis]|uniref:Helix-turn-helix domain-containing protein n=1 Tax=Rhodococcus erythropolis TaxID=1833 RepID=A0A8I1D301_RHOER|nr:helix-turn-helix domain-containing protein [Rhodococcus erythropolis]MBH5141435.1 helix-turn-helix domain-containing protein [Rhodococcus erythropolis]
MTTRWSAMVAVLGTAGTGAAAAVLSFAALDDLAARSGVAVPALWPAIVDGVVIVATVAVVAGAGRYAWGLLVVGALVSIAGNIVHAALPDGVLPVWLRATVAAVPPVALVAVAHLAVRLQHAPPRSSVSRDTTTPSDHPTIDADVAPQPAVDRYLCASEEELCPGTTGLPFVANVLVNGNERRASGGAAVVRARKDDLRLQALARLATGTSPQTVAGELGVHRATVYRWRRAVSTNEVAGLDDGIKNPPVNTQELG